jgi:hypothetical protein
MSDSCSAKRALEKTLEHLLKMLYVAIFGNLRENENMGDAISQRRKCWTDLFGEL